MQSDLYSWREIFQLYVETQVFESLHESDRGERSVEESERRLKLFGERATQRSHDRSQFKLKSSRDALDAFLQLNVSILNVKRVRIPIYLLFCSSLNPCTALVSGRKCRSGTEDCKET